MNGPCSKVLGGLLMLSTGFLPAETVKDREGAVRGDKASLEDSERWIYGDYRGALAKGKETGTPVMVTLRCVPCLACAGFDAEVLRERTELTPLLDQFICVRVINANDLDISMFQFDYDLSFSALFGQYNQHAAAKRAGFRKGDVLVQVDGADKRMTEHQLIASLLRTRRKGETVEVTVLRGGREVGLQLPMQ
jgi:hypothetical protein